MLGFITSILTGGATGLLGVALQRVFDWLKVGQEIKLRQIDHDHEEKMRRVDIEMLNAEWEHRAKVAEIETQGKVDAEEAKAFAKSFASEPQLYSAKVTPTTIQGYILIFLDLVRGLVRPGLTLYLCIITTMMYLEVMALVKLYGMVMNAETAMSLMDKIISTILYLTTTCVLWWFGTRNKQKPPGAK